MTNENAKNPKLFVDNEPLDWEKDTINGAEIRTLAALPEGVQIFHKIPGKPDAGVKDNTDVDLTKHPGPDRFYSQAVGSQAGGNE